MAQAALLQGIRIEQNIAQATGRRFALHLFLDQWHVLRTVPEGESEQRIARLETTLREREAECAHILLGNSGLSAFALALERVAS